MPSSPSSGTGPSTSSIDNAPEALVLIGAYGVGKSSVAQEIAELLEQRRIGYALLDLDFLTWFDTGRADDVSEAVMLRANLVPVIANYRRAGVRRFLVAGTLADRSALEELAGIFAMPIRIVRLTLPVELIARRLQPDVTAGRAADLAEARAQLQRGDGVGIEDRVIANDRPIRDVATDILDWLGWATHVDRTV